MAAICKGFKEWWGQAVIAIMVFSIAGCAARPYRITNFFTSPAIGELREKRIAVIPFKNLSPVPQAGELVTDEFNLQMGKLGRFRLVERLRIQELLKEQDLDPERIDESTAVKIGKMLGAHAIILGTVTTYYPYKYKEKKEVEERERKKLERMKIEAEKAPKTVVVVKKEEHHHYYPGRTHTPPGQEKDKDKEKDKKEKDKGKDKEKDKGKGKGRTKEKKEEGSVWIAVAVIGGIILTGGILYFVLRHKPTAEAGISVRMVNIETGEQIWQAKDTFKGNDARVQALVESADKNKLTKDVDYLSRILCREAAQTIEE